MNVCPFPSLLISNHSRAIPQAWLQQFGYAKGDGTYTITTSDESLVVSILSAGTFFGALLAAPAGDILGRRWGCVPFSLRSHTSKRTLLLVLSQRVSSSPSVSRCKPVPPLSRSSSSVVSSLVSASVWCPVWSLCTSPNVRPSGCAVL